MHAARGAGHVSLIVPRAAACVLFVFGLYPLANRLTDGEAVQWYRHALIHWTFVGGLLLLALLALGRWQAERMTQLAAVSGRYILAVPAPVFVTVLGAIALALSAWLAVTCFGRQPHNADEVAQLFHAKILLSGRLSLPADPNPEFFGMDNMIDRGRWYSQFPIGGPAFLAIGVASGAPWLLNPALIALTIAPLYLFTRRVYDESTARAAAMLLAMCPFALFMGASFMNHAPTLLLCSIALWQVSVWDAAPTVRARHLAGMIVGLALGAAFTIRPLDALAFASVLGLLQLREAWRRSELRTSLSTQIVGGLLPVAVFLYVNMRTTGAPLRLGYEVLYGTAHQLGFHLDPYGTPHTPLRALTYASKYLLQLDVLLFEWPLPAVGVVVAGLMALRRPTRWDVLLIGLVLVQLTAYALYWHDGSFRGPRFLFTVLAPIVILMARAPFLLATALRGAPRIAALYALPTCVVFAWTAYGTGDSVIGRVRQYRKASPSGRISADSVARAAGLHNALVFVNEGREARYLHDLWALGLSRGDAARLIMSAPACAVRLAIEDEVRDPVHDAGRRERMIRRALSFDATAPEPSVCTDDERRDDAGSAEYAVFFPANTIDSLGRLGGNVVYALEQGERDEVLRTRFGNRAWYRFGPRAHAGDALPTLVPYVIP